MLAPIRNQLVVAANGDRARSLADMLAEMIHTLSSIFFLCMNICVCVFFHDRLFTRMIVLSNR